jgi:hypothetical protein
VLAAHRETASQEVQAGAGALEWAAQAAQAPRDPALARLGAAEAVVCSGVAEADRVPLTARPTSRAAVEVAAAPHWRLPAGASPRTSPPAARGDDHVQRAHVAGDTPHPNNHFTVSQIKAHRDGTITFTVKVPGRGAIDVLETTAKCDLARVAVLLQPGAHRFVFARAHKTYSFAWLDVREEPMVVSVPDSPDRYYLAPMLDMWTEVFAVPGTRTTGGRAGNFAMAAPGWDGSTADGVELLRAPTPIVWVMGRTQTNGPDDYDAVHAVQDQFRITPLSAWGRDYVPPAGLAVDPEADDETAPLAQVNAMSGVELLSAGAELMRIHPPHAHDYPILFRMRELGLRPGESFAWWVPRELNSRPEPTTRSLTVRETSTSSGPARAETRAPILTARPVASSPKISHWPVCNPVRTPMFNACTASAKSCAQLTARAGPSKRLNDPSPIVFATRPAASVTCSRSSSS